MNDSESAEEFGYRLSQYLLTNRVLNNSSDLDWSLAITNLKNRLTSLSLTTARA